MTDKLLYTKAETAELLSVSPQTLMRMLKAGTGPRPSRIGSRVLFAKDELTRFASATVAA